MQAHTGAYNTHTEYRVACSVSCNHTQTINTFRPHKILNLRTEGDKHIYHTSVLSFFITVRLAFILYLLPFILHLPFLPSSLYHLFQLLGAHVS